MDARTLERRLAKLTSILEVAKALTASDRPYKKALPPEQALDILSAEARRGQLDASLLGVFLEAGLWRGVPRW